MLVEFELEDEVHGDEKSECFMRRLRASDEYIIDIDVQCILRKKDGRIWRGGTLRKQAVNVHSHHSDRMKIDFAEDIQLP
jgi:hypothetical protein